ncbi:UDP-N-acetyl-D-mannosamine dehydrogenase [Gammaproteobacteria bacterium]|nr:UDP-N-acetyl-D-mannosamine dehydrogenase [Gammaproteobacteria bacterium]
MKFKKISVIGLGYIGLPTAAIFASHEIEVVGIDVNKNVVDIINQGAIHIMEPDLDLLVDQVVKKGFLRATTVPEASDAFLIAVPTPFIGNNKKPDLSYIESASIAIAPVLKSGDIVILESTSPVGATEKVAAWLAKARPDLTFPQINGQDSDVRVAHCPERVLPGQVLKELVSNDRVIGGMTTKCGELAEELYKVFVKGEFVHTNCRTAEMSKLAENSFRDVNIAFANELSIICDELNINIWELISIANLHPRVNILQPGPGVGGHCIAVDPWFIVSGSPEHATLIRTARQVNDFKSDWVMNKVTKAIGEYLQENPNKTAKEVVVACYGLTFKPDIDDLRESPALKIAKKIVANHSGVVHLIEPNISELPINQSLESAVLNDKLGASSANIHIVLVDHSEFRKTKFTPKLNVKLVDTRGVWS